MTAPLNLANTNKVCKKQKYTISLIFLKTFGYYVFVENNT